MAIAHNKTSAFRQMRRWSDAKLDAERCFADAADDGSAECRAWLNAIIDEQTRRQPLNTRVDFEAL